VEPLFLEGETNAEWGKRVLSRAELAATLTVRSVPLRLTRRSKAEELF
jgi:hypothetical protein